VAGKWDWVDFLEQTLPTGREEISWPVDGADPDAGTTLWSPRGELQIAEAFSMKPVR